MADFDSWQPDVSVKTSSTKNNNNKTFNPVKHQPLILPCLVDFKIIILKLSLNVQSHGPVLLIV